LTQRLFKHDLKGTRIDLREKVSLVDELTFLERNTDELTIDATANRDGIEGCDGAKTIEVNAQIAALCGGNDNRHNQTACAGTSLALAGSSGRSGVGYRAAVP
jgi:hypothetical protein